MSNVQRAAGHSQIRYPLRVTYVAPGEERNEEAETVNLGMRPGEPNDDWYFSDLQ